MYIPHSKTNKKNKQTQTNDNKTKDKTMRDCYNNANYYDTNT